MKKTKSAGEKTQSTQTQTHVLGLFRKKCSPGEDSRMPSPTSSRVRYDDSLFEAVPRQTKKARQFYGTTCPTSTSRRFALERWRPSYSNDDDKTGVDSTRQPKQLVVAHSRYRKDGSAGDRFGSATGRFSSLGLRGEEAENTPRGYRHPQQYTNVTSPTLLLIVPSRAV